MPRPVGGGTLPSLGPLGAWVWERLCFGVRHTVFCFHGAASCCESLAGSGHLPATASLQVTAGPGVPVGSLQLLSRLLSPQDGALTNWAFISFQQGWEETCPNTGDLGEVSHCPEPPFPRLE